MDKVSVIIPTYNRFHYLLNAIKSVKEQTYKNIEIIVVNDCSIQKEYYSFDFKKNFGDEFYILHLPKNSKEIFGIVSPGGHARNIGMMISSGTYIAFLDDDDYFLPNKIEKQLKFMKKKNYSISCSEAYCGKGPYQVNSKYKTYHYNGKFWKALINIFKNQNKIELLNKMYENNVTIWGKKEIYTHNCTCGGSSIIMKKDLIKKAGYFPIKNFGDDWEYWKKLIKYSDCVYIREPLTYIDISHGDGKNY